MWETVDLMHLEFPILSHISAMHGTALTYTCMHFDMINANVDKSIQTIQLDMVSSAICISTNQTTPPVPALNTCLLQVNMN